MCVRHLGFVLLVWFPGVLRAQSAALHCGAPRLSGGYLVPEQETYSHKSELTYACDNGRKPAVEGWWATSTCLNGKWSHEPQCIDEEACIPPEIPNAKYTENQNGWYENGHTIRITCDQGYEPKDRDVTARCITGTWSSVPVCERSIQACGEPPKIPHAVIIHQEYQEVFAVDSEVQYECEDGYTVEEADGNKSIFCIAGNWTEGPTCRTGPGTGHRGSTVGGTDGTQPGRGSSTTSGLNDRDSRPLLTTINHCGAHPNVPNGVVVQVERMFLKYQCNGFYTQVGSDTVTCYSNGRWSQLPICKEAFCVLDPAKYKWDNFELSKVEYLKDGETKQFLCTWADWRRIFQCTNGKITYTRCCHADDIYRGVCRYS